MTIVPLVCPICGATFYTDSSIAHRRFTCSKLCNVLRGRNAKTNEDRLMEKIHKTETCWLWTGAKTGRGYGNFQSRAAHRAVYELFVGEIPDGMVLDHLCRNPICVNPDHLEVVTQCENLHRGMHPSHIPRRTGLCKRGHEFTDETAYVSPSGRRMCKVCMKERSIRWYRKYLELKRSL